MFSSCKQQQQQRRQQHIVCTCTDAYHIAGEIFAMLPYINMLLYTMA